jgi:O-acetyl-ADP-ribose deacetylase (regulator of RNase III)
VALAVYLCDKNAEVVKAWQAFFGRGAKVTISEGDVLTQQVSVLVSPCNSFGIMEDGLALALHKATDSKIESRFRKLLQDKHAGELPVGQAEIMTTGIAQPERVIFAPTVRVPQRMNAANVNAFLATRAALRVLAQFMRQETDEKGSTHIESIAFVGMGTGGGRTSPATAAFQMYEAYCQIVLGQEPNFATIEAAIAHDQELRKNRFV